MAVKKRQKSLSHGRPQFKPPKERMSSQQSRTVIRTHHRLHKEHAAAVKRGDAKAAESIAKSIEKNGGLKVYQAASRQGQSKDRGGDSSKVLVEWLRQLNVIQSAQPELSTDVDVPYRCLEVGALSVQNEISKLPTQIKMTRIDLNSQGPGIEQQDFMKRPLPRTEDEHFDIISLSLVLNYVPDPAQRGEMLKRVTQFLKTAEAHEKTKVTALPALFLVLPLPCMDNSRYLDEDLLVWIMADLGFSITNKKNTPKLCYYLFSMSSKVKSTKSEKRKVRDGPGMNNFCIVVD